MKKSEEKSKKYWAEAEEELERDLAAAIASGEGNADWIKDLPEGPPFPLDSDEVVAVFLQKATKKKKRAH